MFDGLILKGQAITGPQALSKYISAQIHEGLPDLVFWPRMLKQIEEMVNK